MTTRREQDVRVEAQPLSNEEFARKYRNISSRMNRILDRNDRERAKQIEAKDAGEEYLPKIVSSMGVVRAQDELNAFLSDTGRMEYARASESDKVRMSEKIQELDDWKTLKMKGAKAHAESLDTNFSPLWRNYGNAELSAIVEAVRDQYVTFIANTSGAYFDSDQLNILISEVLAANDFEVTFEEVTTLNSKGIEERSMEATFASMENGAYGDLEEFIVDRQSQAKAAGAEVANDRIERRQAAREARGDVDSVTLYDEL